MINETMEFLKDILFQLPTHIYWKNREGQYQWCNQAHLESLGLKDIHDIIGKTDADLIWKEQAVKLMALDQQIMADNKIVESEETVKLSNHKTAIFLSKKTPLKDPSSRIIGLLGVSVDITLRKKNERALKRAKEKAEAANRAKTAFLENMRHDIRTPLTGIIGVAELLKTENSIAKIRDYADDLMVSSQSLLNYLNTILETIRATSGEVPVLKAVFNLKETLVSIIHLHRAKVAEKKLELCLDYNNALPIFVRGDAKRLHGILLELITNALKFTDQGRVIVTVEKTTQSRTKNLPQNLKKIFIKFTVTDTGMGIPNDFINTVCVLFNRLSASHKGLYSGTGLGLTLVQQSIKALEGKLYIRSMVGKGSEFSCVIPFELINKPTRIHDKKNEKVVIDNG